ncbi:hypothetical protein IWQ61_008059 [Dispira simplex]|nr:hypothetical protein IWQ61_008059 [Dispira simplex]
MAHDSTKVLKPYVTVQHDWQRDVFAVLQKKVTDANFWLSRYKQGNPSQHFTVKVTPSNDTPGYQLDAEPENPTQSSTCPAVRLQPLGPFAFEMSTISHLENSTDSSSSSVVCCAPNRIALAPLPSGAVQAFDVTPDSAPLYVVGGQSGQLKVVDAEVGSEQIALVGHKGDITTCRFFPSGKVALSGSTDLQLRIWSAINGSNPVTLTGHTKAITDTAIIGRGRTILSTSRDGTVRLWECGTSRQLAKLDIGLGNLGQESNISAPSSPLILDQVLRIALDSPSTPTNSTDAEAATGFVSTERGLLHRFDTRQMQHVVGTTQSLDGVPLTALACNTMSSMVVSGSQLGVLEMWDTRRLDCRLGALQRNNATIHDLTWIDLLSSGTSELTGPSVATVTGDGLGFITQLSSAGDGNVHPARVTHELTGTDIDPLFCVRVASGLPSSSLSVNYTPDQKQGLSRRFPSIFVAGRDGIIKRY